MNKMTEDIYLDEDAQAYENFPDEVKCIVDSWVEDSNPYEECARIKAELECIGWTCDYGLSGEIYDVKIN